MRSEISYGSGLPVAGCQLADALFNAFGGCKEVNRPLLVAERLRFLKDDDLGLIDEVDKLAVMTMNFIRKVGE